MGANRKSKKRKYIILTLAAMTIIAAAVIVMVGLSVLRGSVVERDSILYIETRTSYGALLDSLSEGGRVLNIARLDRFARLMKLGDSIRPGRYELRKGMDARSVVGMFRSGNQAPLEVTFNNIRTLQELAGRLGEQLCADSTEFVRYLTDDSIAARYGFSHEEFIGMFIPNTYQLYWTISPERFLDRMAREYDRFWNDDRQKKLATANLTRNQASALASIVEEETNRADEMSTIAGVYLNRIKIGMPLQADPTVKFALGDPTLKRVLHKHLSIDSPYNTYKYRGIPPGPIRMPSIQAIDAVLNYQKHDYVYFCAKSDFSGYHAFAKTLAEHNRNARAYSDALNAAGIK